MKNDKLYEVVMLFDNEYLSEEVVVSYYYGTSIRNAKKEFNEIKNYDAPIPPPKNTKIVLELREVYWNLLGSSIREHYDVLDAYILKGEREYESKSHPDDVECFLDKAIYDGEKRS